MTATGPRYSDLACHRAAHPCGGWYCAAHGQGWPCQEGADLFPLDPRRSPTGTCWSFEDGMDGFDIHAEQCPRAGWAWTSGSGCIGLRTWRGRWPDWVGRRA